MPDPLARALHDVVEASAEPVTVEEVLGLPEPRPERTRWPLLLAAAAVVVAAAVGGLLLAGRDASAPDRSPVATSPPPDGPSTLDDCVRGFDDHGGCTVDDAQASALLGVDVGTPEGIPEGWTLLHHEVRHYVDDHRRTFTEYNRSWFRNPDEAHPAFAENTVVECSPSPCDLPDYVQLMVVVGVPEPASDLRYPLVTRRPDGTRVNGFSNEDDHFLRWERDGATFRLRASGISRADALQIVDSLL